MVKINSMKNSISTMTVVKKFIPQPSEVHNSIKLPGRKNDAERAYKFSVYILQVLCSAVCMNIATARKKHIVARFDSKGDLLLQ